MSFFSRIATFVRTQQHQFQVKQEAGHLYQQIKQESLVKRRFIACLPFTHKVVDLGQLSDKVVAALHRDDVAREVKTLLSQRFVKEVNEPRLVDAIQLHQAKVREIHNVDGALLVEQDLLERHARGDFKNGKFDVAAHNETVVRLQEERVKKLNSDCSTRLGMRSLFRETTLSADILLRYLPLRNEEPTLDIAKQDEIWDAVSEKMNGRESQVEFEARVQRVFEQIDAEAQEVELHAGGSNEFEPAASIEFSPADSVASTTEFTPLVSLKEISPEASFTLEFKEPEAKAA